MFKSNFKIISYIYINIQMHFPFIKFINITKVHSNLYQCNVYTETINSSIWDSSLENY